jgi:hypothetical protein
MKMKTKQFSIKSGSHELSAQAGLEPRSFDLSLQVARKTVWTAGSQQYSNFFMSFWSHFKKLTDFLEQFLVGPLSHASPQFLNY